MGLWRQGGAHQVADSDGAGGGSYVPDGELLAAAQEGDYGAFETLVQRYHERVFRLAYGMTKSQTEAEEAVQETFLSIFRNLDRYRAESSPASWFYRVAVNTVLMTLRTKRRKPLLPLDDTNATPSVPRRHEADRPPTAQSIWPAGDWARQPDDKLLSRELGQRIEAAIADLPDKYRLVLLLRDVEGQSNEAVAQTLGLTIPTVKARLHRSRLLVRQALEHYFVKR